MKKIIILILCLLMLTGCSAKRVASHNAVDNFVIVDKENGIVADAQTDICYYIIAGYASYTYTPFYGTDKQLVTKDEYLEKYK